MSLNICWHRREIVCMYAEEDKYGNSPTCMKLLTLRDDDTLVLGNLTFGLMVIQFWLFKLGLAEFNQLMR